MNPLYERELRTGNLGPRLGWRGSGAEIAEWKALPRRAQVQAGRFKPVEEAAQLLSLGCFSQRNKVLKGSTDEFCQP